MLTRTSEAAALAVPNSSARVKRRVRIVFSDYGRGCGIEYQTALIAPAFGLCCVNRNRIRAFGGALAFSEPEKSQKLIRDIVESAYDHGADMIVTPCPLCQANVEIYQDEINRKQGTKLDMPVLYYSQLMAVAYGGSAKDAGLDGQVIRAPKLEEIAARK